MSDSNPLHEPEGDGMEMVMPFVVCQSNGGPYDDDAFAAGWQAGEIDQGLKAASAVRAASVRWDMVRTALLPQLELVAMHRGFPKVLVDRYEEYPDWCDVTFVREVSGE